MEIETFKEPFLTKVIDALDNAVSIAWDGCHKIYILGDQVSHEEQIELGYTPELVEDKEAALARLWKWWNSSCSLKFINRIEGSVKNKTETFFDVIPQCEYDEETV
jgi:hypothetical protein